MARTSAREHRRDRLTLLERNIIRFCFDRRDEMTYLIDMTTALADLPRTLQGQWFDARLLAPNQKARHAQIAKEVDRALRRLFQAGLIDVGREDSFPEGFKRRHRDVVAAMQSDSYWLSRSGRVPTMDVIEQNVRFHQTWAEVAELKSAIKEMGGPIELIGLSPAGRELAQVLAADQTPEGTGP